MLRRSFLSLPLLPVASGLFAGAARAEARDTVRIAHSTNGFAFLPLLVAVVMDHFKEAGVNVEVVRTGSGATAMAAAISGDVDICLEDPVSVLRARGNGSDLVIFGALITQVNANVVVSKAWAAQHNVTHDSPVEQKLAALKGIRLGITGVGSGSDNVSRYMARKAGLDPDRDLTIVGLGSEASPMLAGLELGRIDGITISAPTDHLAISKLGATMLFNLAAGEFPPLNGYFYIGMEANRAWLDANKVKATKVAKGFQLALSAIADPAITTVVRDRVRARYFAAVDKPTFDSIWVDQTGAAPKTIQVTRDMVKRVVDTAAEFVGKPIDPALIDTSFVTTFADAVQQ
jgi:NitT/TauT family transport system substrate-binding protein